MPAYPALLDPSVDSYKVMRESVNSLITALGNTTVVAHNQSAITITSGVLDIARLPVGILGTEVALGNHTHTAGEIAGFTDNSANWDTAFTWGDWAGHTHAGYLEDTEFATAGIMATDGAGTYSIVSNNSGNWDAAFTHVSAANTHLPALSTEGYVLGIVGGVPAWQASGAGGDVNQNAFSNIAVSGYSTVVADTITDTVTFVAGTNMSITTNAASDQITFNATDADTWRPISNSTSSTSSTVSASSAAVKAAYDVGNHTHNYAAVAHSHTGTTISALDAGDTTTGTFLIGRIPTGTTSTTVALGNHSHAATSGTNITWTAGTTNGPVCNSSTGTSAAIPKCSDTASGVITTSTQAIAGQKLFTFEVIANAGIYVTGEVHATGNVIGFYSDDRLKNRLSTIDNALDQLARLNGFYYTGNDVAKSLGYTDTRVQMGLSAQEIELINPAAVHLAPCDRAKDGTSKSGENYKTAQYEKIIPLLVEAIKELNIKVQMLEGKA